MSKIDFGKSAEQIVELVGGKENIEQIAHCVTRVRFTLKDNSIGTVNKEQILKSEGVLQVVEAGGQFQVVIGTQVQKMYDVIMPLLGDEECMESDKKESAKDDKKPKKAKASDQIMKLVSGIMMPVIPALAGCGLDPFYSNFLKDIYLQYFHSV